MLSPEHTCVDDVRRELKYKYQNAGKEGEYSQVVEHQPEKAIQISDYEPFIFLWIVHIRFIDSKVPTEIVSRKLCVDT